MSYLPTARLFRLRTLTAKDLPPHPSVKPVSADHVELFDFLRTVLDEAVSFADEVVPQTFKEGAATKESPPAAAKVKILSRDIKPSELPHMDAKGESWFARHSLHADARADGTADFAEFDEGLRRDHSVHEMEYTPTVFDAHKVADWNELIAQKGGKVGSKYEEVSMTVYEMCHRMPAVVANRVFPVLVLTAKLSPTSFVVAQVPIDLTDFPDADVLYANGRNKRDGDTPLKKKKVIVGKYVSVERVETTQSGEVSWLMATASDARGALPIPLQKLGIPDAVLKDVGLFIQWVMDNRKSS